MGTKVEFGLLVLVSLKYNSKAESTNNRSAKAIISRKLTTSRHNHLFNFLFLYLFVIFICYFIFYMYLPESRDYHLI